jgi:surfeit locus 1 family protein
MNVPTTPSHERRFRPRLLPTVASAVGIALFVAAGQWQQRRMEQKEALRMQVDSASTAAPAALPRGVVDWTAWRYRPVVVIGSFEAARQILIDNKVLEGRAGYHVVTPLILEDGRAVLVDRGWISAGATRAQIPSPAPPAGKVEVQGRINIPTANYIELTRGVPEGAVWQNLDPERVAQATGIALLPIVVEQTAPMNAGDDLVRAWPAPDFGVEQHRIYMVQWYLFAALAAGLWLFFNLRRSTIADGDA